VKFLQVASENYFLAKTWNFLRCSLERKSDWKLQRELHNQRCIKRHNLYGIDVVTKILTLRYDLISSHYTSTFYDYENKKQIKNSEHLQNVSCNCREKYPPRYGLHQNAKHPFLSVARPYFPSCSSICESCSLKTDKTTFFNDVH